MSSQTISSLTDPTPGKKRKRTKDKNKKKNKTAKAVVTEQTSTKAEKSLLYLRNWCNRQECEWKFKKAHQVYLLKHGLRMSMSEEDFSIFCRYMNGLPDSAKSSLKQAAQQIVDDQDADEEHQEKARRLIQSLDFIEKEDGTSSDSSHESDDE